MQYPFIAHSILDEDDHPVHHFDFCYYIGNQCPPKYEICRLGTLGNLNPLECHVVILDNLKPIEDIFAYCKNLGIFIKQTSWQSFRGHGMQCGYCISMEEPDAMQFRITFGEQVGPCCDRRLSETKQIEIQRQRLNESGNLFGYMP